MPLSIILMGVVFNVLNAVMQDEKNVQDKVKKAIQMQGRKLEKDW